VSDHPTLIEGGGSGQSAFSLDHYTETLQRSTFRNLSCGTVELPEICIKAVRLKAVLSLTRSAAREQPGLPPQRTDGLTLASNSTRIMSK
jgi:hypothetical protein